MSKNVKKIPYLFLDQRLLTILKRQSSHAIPTSQKNHQNQLIIVHIFLFISISPPISFTRRAINSLLSWYLCICSIAVTTFPSFIPLRLDLINRWNLSSGECIVSASDAISRRKKADSYATVCQRVRGSTISLRPRRGTSLEACKTSVCRNCEITPDWQPRIRNLSNTRLAEIAAKSRTVCRLHGSSMHLQRVHLRLDHRPDVPHTRVSIQHTFLAAVRESRFDHFSFGTNL